MLPGIVKNETDNFFVSLFFEGEDFHPPLTKADVGDNVWVSTM